MDSAPILALLIILAVPLVSFIFYCYLLMNRRTKQYFSRQSVEIRRQARNRGQY